MENLTPLETLFAKNVGPDLPLPEAISQIYGRLDFPVPGARPYVISNFVTTLDGVVTLGIPGRSGGGEISGFNTQDRFLMGLLRAVSDVVLISTSNLMVAPDQVWTPEAVFPDMAEEYHRLRAALGKPDQPTTVIVTSAGRIDPALRLFQSHETPVAVLTSQVGAQAIAARLLPDWVQVRIVKPEGLFQAGEIVAAAQKVAPNGIYLMEAGPHLHATFFESGHLDELFLTLAPQISGRLSGDIRLGLVAGHLFAPDNPIWGTLYTIKRGESHLFLRYGFPDSSR